MKALALYGAFLATSFRTGLAARGFVVGRTAFYILVLFVFSRLWQVVYAKDIRLPGSPADMVWYLAVTEWVIISLPTIHLSIENDVRRGDVAYQLMRPVSYLYLKLAEAGGSLLLNLLVLGVTGFVVSYLFSGSFPSHPSALIALIPLGILSAFIALIFQTTIGLTSFWLQDSLPLFWVWQKSLFILGGLILPLELYPRWLFTVAEFTPFSAMLWRPGHLLHNFGIASFTVTLGLLFAWGVVAWVLMQLTFALARRDLEVNGG
jgi:ABC-2 type transport system permease protein